MIPLLSFYKEFDETAV